MNQLQGLSLIVSAIGFIGIISPRHSFALLCASGIIGAFHLWGIT